MIPTTPTFTSAAWAGSERGDLLIEAVLGEDRMRPDPVRLSALALGIALQFNAPRLGAHADKARTALAGFLQNMPPFVSIHTVLHEVWNELHALNDGRGDDAQEKNAREVDAWTVLTVARAHLFPAGSESRHYDLRRMLSVTAMRASLPRERRLLAELVRFYYPTVPEAARAPRQQEEGEAT